MGEMAEVMPALHHLDRAAAAPARKAREALDPLAEEFYLTLGDLAALGVQQIRDRPQCRRSCRLPLAPSSATMAPSSQRQRDALQHQRDAGCRQTSMLATSRMGVGMAGITQLAGPPSRPHPELVEGLRERVLVRGGSALIPATSELVAEPFGPPSPAILRQAQDEGRRVLALLGVAGLRALRPARVLLGVILRGFVNQRLHLVGHRQRYRFARPSAISRRPIAARKSRRGCCGRRRST